LVRNRFHRLIAMILMIQRKFRFHLSKNPKFRAKSCVAMRKRQGSAISIQTQYRVRRDKKAVEKKKEEARLAEAKKSEPQRVEAASEFLREVVGNVTGAGMVPAS
jgi:hypothetical protein